MNDLALTRRWLAARIKLTLRNPRAVTFTFAFPLVLVVLFNALNGDTMVKSAGANVPFSQFYTPAIGVFSLVAACYTTAGCSSACAARRCRWGSTSARG